MIEIELETHGRVEAIDVTDRLAQFLCPDGLLWVSCPHTTAALLLTEADADLLSDIEATASQLLGPLEPFRHCRNGKPNASAHILSGMMGTQLLLPVIGGRPDVGTYQRVVFLEMDGPRRRRLRIELLPTAGLGG